MNETILSSEPSPIEAARVAVSRHCYECGAKCCRKGMLNLNVAEAAAMTKKRPRALLMKEWDGTATLKLTPQCPALGPKNNCTIYQDRPSACRTYPFYEYGKKVIIAPCPPVAQGLLDKELAAIKQAGYTII